MNLQMVLSLMFSLLLETLAFWYCILQNIFFVATLHLVSLLMHWMKILYWETSYPI